MEHPTDRPALVYGLFGESLFVAMPEERAEQLAQARQAERSATTWGEYRAGLPSPLREQLETNLRGSADGRIPPDEAGFDPMDVPGAADLWPGWAPNEMLDWVPPELQERFGRRAVNTNGDAWLAVDPADGPAFIAALRALGYPCREDAVLVLKAHGGA